MSRTWFTADLHLGHTLVASDRGYDNTDNHDEQITATWANQIGTNDTVFVLGDVALGNLDGALGMLRTLPGEKHLIAGNHDSCHPMHRRWIGQLDRYQQTFRTVQPFGTVRINRQKVAMSHFPYDGDHTDVDRYADWRLRSSDTWLLHGHTHSRKCRSGVRSLHVGWDTHRRLLDKGEVERLMSEPWLG